MSGLRALQIVVAGAVTGLGHLQQFLMTIITLMIMIDITTHLYPSLGLLHQEAAHSLLISSLVPTTQPIKKSRYFRFLDPFLYSRF